MKRDLADLIMCLIAVLSSISIETVMILVTHEPLWLTLVFAFGFAWPFWLLGIVWGMEEKPWST